MNIKLVLFTALLAAAGAQTARADTLFVSGSTFQVQTTNSPDSFTDNVTLTPGTYSIEGGAVSLNLSIVSAAGGAEWLVFNYSTVSGGAFRAGSANLNRAISGVSA
jgi:lipopolysaccharide export system protein LptA